jgi:ribosomal-protein-alanine N-acetyltransferase
MDSVKAQKQEYRIRWMIRGDMPEVLKIEKASNELAWTKKDFNLNLYQINCLGVVAEESERIVGFKIYELYRTELRLLNLTVLPSARRRGVGTQLLANLVSKLSSQRSRIFLEVRETNINAQLFFRSQGFRATKVLPRFWVDSDEDAYVMQYRQCSTPSECNGVGATHRRKAES